MANLTEDLSVSGKGTDDTSIAENSKFEPMSLVDLENYLSFSIINNIVVMICMFILFIIMFAVIFKLFYFRKRLTGLLYQKNGGSDNTLSPPTYIQAI